MPQIPATSLEEQLLHASLLCGMRPESHPAHRLQLFFICNHDLGSLNRQNDYQRCIETGVESKGLWENYPAKNSGQYRITHKGYDRAVQRFGEIEAKYRPVAKSECNFSLAGDYGGKSIEISFRRARTHVLVDGKECSDLTKARQELDSLGANLRKSSGASYVFYDFGIDHKFDMTWKSRGVSAVTTRDSGTRHWIFQANPDFYDTATARRNTAARAEA